MPRREKSKVTSDKVGNPLESEQHSAGIDSVPALKLPEIDEVSHLLGLNIPEILLQGDNPSQPSVLSRGLPGITVKKNRHPSDEVAAGTVGNPLETKQHSAGIDSVPALELPEIDEARHLPGLNIPEILIQGDYPPRPSVPVRDLPEISVKKNQHSGGEFEAGVLGANADIAGQARVEAKDTRHRLSDVAEVPKPPGVSQEPTNYWFTTSDHPVVGLTAREGSMEPFAVSAANSALPPKSSPLPAERQHLGEADFKAVWEPTAKSPIEAPEVVVSRTDAFPVFAKLWLTPRDSFCVCAYWEIDESEFIRFRSVNPGGHWQIRLWQPRLGGQLTASQSLPFGVSFRFMPVLEAGGDYQAELGFMTQDGRWFGLALSLPIQTPPDGPSANRTGHLTQWHLPATSSKRYDRRPAIVPPRHFVVSLPELGVTELLNEILGDQPARVYQNGSETLHQATSGSLPAKSMEVEELSEIAQAPAGISSTELVVPPKTNPATSSFWFKVNAEVVVFGSTERDALLAIGGRPIPLRDDGSFSFRFSLPDGCYELPIIAAKADGSDSRTATMKLTRGTEVRGAVGIEVHSTKLKPPRTDSLD